MMPRSLFDRLPLGLFRPLAAGTTAERNWRLLVALFEQDWAPGVAALGEEIEKSCVVRLIESQLILMGSAAHAEDEAPDTPIAIRANNAYLPERAGTAQTTPTSRRRDWSGWFPPPGGTPRMSSPFRRVDRQGSTHSLHSAPPESGPSRGHRS